MMPKIEDKEQGVGENEVLAAGHIAYSGKRRHMSDCATSCAPAYRPGPCDCDYPAVGSWNPIAHYSPAHDGVDVLICGGTYSYDAEAFPADRPFNGVSIARLNGGEWCGNYGSEYDGQYWHRPEWFAPLPALPPLAQPSPPSSKGSKL